MLIIQNENSDILRYLLSLQRNRVKAMQSEIEYQGFGTRYRERKRLPAFAVLAFSQAGIVKGLSEPPNQRGYEGKRPSKQRCSLLFGWSFQNYV